MQLGVSIVQHGLPDILAVHFHTGEEPSEVVAAMAGGVEDGFMASPLDEEARCGTMLRPVASSPCVA